MVSSEQFTVLLTVASSTIILIVLIICLTIFFVLRAVLKNEREAMIKDEREASTKRDLERFLIEKGYVQISVPKSDFQKTGGHAHDSYIIHDRKWELAWVPADKLDTVLATFHVEDDDPDIEGLLGAALHPT